MSSLQIHRKARPQKCLQKAGELTKGKVKVEVYANSTLYKDKEEMEALQLGAVQMLAPSLAKFGPLGVKEFEVFDLPFIFSNYDDLRKVTNGPVGKGLLAKLEPSSSGLTGFTTVLTSSGLSNSSSELALSARTTVLSCCSSHSLPPRS